MGVVVGVSVCIIRRDSVFTIANMISNLLKDNLESTNFTSNRHCDTVLNAKKGF